MPRQSSYERYQALLTRRGDRRYDDLIEVECQALYYGVSECTNPPAYLITDLEVEGAKAYAYCGVHARRFQKLHRFYRFEKA